MGETSGGQLRFVRQETPITPQRLPRFCIEVDDALRVGGSGFLGASDAGEEDEGSVLAGFPKVGETLIVDTLDLEHHA